MQAPKRTSLISGVATCLRDAILGGEVQDHLPNVRTLSRDLNVSVPTILGAIKILDEEGLLIVRQGHPTTIVSPSRTASSPGASVTRRVVILGFPPNNLKASLHFHDVAEGLRRANCEVQFHQLEKKIWGLTAREFERIVNLYTADCWVLVGCPPAVQKMFSDRNLSCILDGGASSPGLAIPDIEIDFVALYRHLAHQFLQLGHERIHLLIGDRSAKLNPGSINAFVQVVQERFPNQRKESLIRVYDGSLSHLQSTLEELFSKSVKPTALCVALVSRMIFTQTWLLSHGYRIPGDVSLICRDSDEFVDCLVPKPARYSTNTKLIARRMVRMIVAKVEHAPLKEHTLYLPDFVPGETLGPVPEDSKSGASS